MEEKVKNWDQAPIQTVKMRDLVFDWSIYPRKAVDQATVENYARALESGADFPPIKIGLYQGKKIVVDGFHRVSARQRFLLDFIEAKFLPFETEAALFAEAVRLNNSHGKGFSESELKANIRRLQQYNFSVKEIQSLIYFPKEEIRKEFTTPILTITTPSGKKVSYHFRSNGLLPDKNDYYKLQKLKDALKLCDKWAESEQLSINNAELAALVIRCHLSLGKVLANI